MRANILILIFYLEPLSFDDCACEEEHKKREKGKGVLHKVKGCIHILWNSAARKPAFLCTYTPPSPPPIEGMQGDAWMVVAPFAV